MYLLDTMILSELRRQHREPRLVAWVKSVRSIDLHLSVVTIGEVERGIARQQGRDPAFAEALAQWLDGVLHHYAARVLPVNVNVARRWGRLAGALGHAGADLLIAATALEAGLIVVTRNTRHFQPTGVRLLDPADHSA